MLNSDPDIYKGVVMTNVFRKAGVCLITLLISLSMFSLIGCGSSSSSKDVLNGNLAGSTWYEKAHDFSWTFNNDGSMLMDNTTTTMSYSFDPKPDPDCMRGTLTVDGINSSGSAFVDSYQATIFKDNDGTIQMLLTDGSVEFDFVLK